MTYIIGDVHGEYDNLIQLINKFQKNSEVIFVGDIVDRGKKSNKVIELIRKNNYKCVLGNHEKMMIDFSEYFIKEYPNIPFMGFVDAWIRNGGQQTLESYDLIAIDKYDGKIICNKNDEGFNQYKEDIKWLKSLPLYIKLNENKDNKPIVISHASIADVWHLVEFDMNKDIVEQYSLWNRKPPKEDSTIFNIYGHTPVSNIDTKKHYINVDTGCCYKKEDNLGKLSAYCIETNEVISV
ncbi:MAG: serine/threonine protein phosphatase [Campylobacteraceae bacterium]|nr:serine/threonine protein phosphatase [Campylobacteraceae bacterium]